MLRELFKSRLYVNIHTSANSNGEIRGQLLANNGSAYVAKLDSAQEAAGLGSVNGNVPGKGTGTFVLNTAGTQLSYQVTVHGLSGAMTNAHIHNAAAGVSGGVVKSLSFTNNTASGIWSSTDASQAFTDSMLSELVRGRLYVNIHTSANSNGEIRGQILPSTGIGFSAKLDSAQEAAGLGSVNGSVPGRGSFALTVGTNGQVSYDGSVSALSGAITNSHIHNAAAGISGGVVKNLSFATSNTATGTWTSSDGSQPFTDSMLRELFKSRLYVNIHTSANSNGEIRGQLGNVGPTTGVVEQISEVMPESFNLYQNYPNPFNPSTTVAFDIRQAAFVSLKIFNLLGQEVGALVNELKQPGSYKVTFDGRTLTSGIYFYRLSTDNFVETRKMVLLK